MGQGFMGGPFNIVRVALFINAGLTLVYFAAGFKTWLDLLSAMLLAFACLYTAIDAWRFLLVGLISTASVSIFQAFKFAAAFGLGTLLIPSWFWHAVYPFILLVGAVITYRSRDRFSGQAGERTAGRCVAVALALLAAGLPWAPVIGEAVADSRNYNAVEVVLLGDRGDYARSTFSENLYIHNAQTGQIVKLQAKDAINCLAASPDGSLIAVGTGIGRSFEAERGVCFQVWETATGALLPFSRTQVALWRDPTVQKIAFSKDGRYLATVVKEVNIEIWSVRDRRMVKAFSLGEEAANRLEGIGGSIYTIDFSPDGRRLLAGGVRGNLNIIDIEEGKVVALLKGGDYCLVEQAVYSPGGGIIYSAVNKLSAARDGQRNGWIDVWDVKDCRRITSLRATPSDGHRIECLACSPEAELMVSGSAGVVRVWDISREELPILIRENAVDATRVGSLAVTTDGKTVLAVVYKGGGRLKKWTIPEAGR